MTSELEGNNGKRCHWWTSWSCGDGQMSPSSLKRWIWGSIFLTNQRKRPKPTMSYFECLLVTSPFNQNTFMWDGIVTHNSGHVHCDEGIMSPSITVWLINVVLKRWRSVARMKKMEDQFWHKQYYLDYNWQVQVNEWWSGWRGRVYVPLKRQRNRLPSDLSPSQIKLK